MSDSPNDRCDKCGAHVSEWDVKPCPRKTVLDNGRHSITRFHWPLPDPPDPKAAE